MLQCRRTRRRRYHHRSRKRKLESPDAPSSKKTKFTSIPPLPPPAEESIIEYRQTDPQDKEISTISNVQDRDASKPSNLQDRVLPVCMSVNIDDRGSNRNVSVEKPSDSHSTHSLLTSSLETRLTNSQGSSDSDSEDSHMEISVAIMSDSDSWTSRRKRKKCMPFSILSPVAKQAMRDEENNKYRKKRMKLEKRLKNRTDLSRYQRSKVSKCLQHLRKSRRRGKKSKRHVKKSEQSRPRQR